MQQSALKHRSLWKRWIPLASIIFTLGIAAFLYVETGHSVSKTDVLVVPLDDAYIHFQYARMIAQGHPFHYYPTDPPTSGATSLIYPFIIAVGYVAGFQGMNIAIWAVAVGIFCWLLAAWLVFQILIIDYTVEQSLPAKQPIQYVIALLMALAFGLSGSIGWAFMSGMETGLMICSVLLTLYFLLRRNVHLALLAATLTICVRPEGIVIGIGTIVYLYAFVRKPVKWFVLILPVAASLIQPLLNYFLTGTLVASGMQSKSFLYAPLSLTGRLSQIVATFALIWRELFTGSHYDGVVYFSVILSICVIALFFSVVWRRLKLERTAAQAICPYFQPTMLIFFWCMGIAGMLSLLETAFWQFDRYQQPLFALWYVVAGWALLHLATNSKSSDVIVRSARYGLASILMIFLELFSLATFASFIGYYRDNTNEAATMIVPMVRYVKSITTPTTRVGVHDVGVMAYLGERPVYDLPGLATPNAASAWLQGPGAMYETLAASQFRPDIFAIYPDHNGLDSFNDTDVFNRVVAQFLSTNPVPKVASATSLQIVAWPLWSHVDNAQTVKQPASIALSGSRTLVDFINVGNLQDEANHDYRWSNSPDTAIPFVTEFHQKAINECTAGGAECLVLDGGRLITASEEFTISTLPGKDLVWITRVYTRTDAVLSIEINNTELGGQLQTSDKDATWLELITRIPASYISGGKTRLHVNVKSGLYTPYYHWFYQ